MVKKIVSNILKILISLLISFLLLSGLLFFFLKEGIQIKSLKLPNIYIERLYLKLDKKFILKIDKLNIKKEKKVDREKDFQNYIRSFKYLPKFFEKIEIKEVDFLNYHVTFLYNNGIYYIDTDRYQLASIIKIRDKKIFLKIPKFLYKKYSLYIFGSSFLDIKNGIVKFNGRFNIENITGNLRFKIENDILDLFAKSDNFKNSELKRVVEKFEIDQEIKNWIYKYIVAKSYNIRYFKAKVNLNSKNIYEPKNFTALAQAYDVDIKFNKKAKSVKCPKITIIFKNDSLFFNLKNPKYLDKNLDGSNVAIKNLSKENSNIDIFIKTKSRFDNDIKNILNAYNIDIPILQKKGNTKGALKINVVFKIGKVDIKGVFSTKESILNIGGYDFFIKEAKLKLKNSKLTIIDSIVKMDNLLLTKLEGDILFDKKVANLKLKDLNLNVEFDKFQILNIKNIDDFLSINFSKKNIIELFLKNLNSKIFISKNRTKIYIENLKKLESFSRLLKKISMKKGNLKIFTTDYKNFKIEGNIEKSNKILAEKNSDFIKRFYFFGNLNKNRSKINFNKNRIVLIYENFPKIYLKNLDIYIGEKFLKNRENSRIEKALFIGKNTDIILDGHRVLSNSFKFKKNRDNFKFFSKYKKGEIRVDGKLDNFKIDVKRVDSLFVKKFFNLYGINNGTYYLKASGNIDNIQGEAKFYNAVLKDLALINNIMAFLNTIGALVTFSDPGYSTKGLLVKNGKILFRLKNKILYIDNLIFNSKSTNIEGSGYINIKKNTIDMILKLQTLKKVTDIIKNIPIAGYVLLGKEGKLSTVLKIEGDLIKPKIKTKLPEETIKAPINIIKRTIKLPFKIFNIGD